MTQARKILFLGPDNSALIPWLSEQGNDVVQTADKISADFVARFDFLLSYGYRHILPGNILSMFPDKAINLHISYLPWNRGADPNFWSFIDDTPKGVTIHYLDEGVDTGDVIAQKTVTFDMARDTLATSYNKLQAEIQDLFKNHWSSIVNGTCQRRKQTGKGSAHKTKDKENLLYLLTHGWETPVSTLSEYAKHRSDYEIAY